MSGFGPATDEFGLPQLSQIMLHDGPDGGVWFGIVESRPIADEIEGKPDTRVAMYVYLGPRVRAQLGMMLLSDDVRFGPPPDVAPGPDAPDLG